METQTYTYCPQCEATVKPVMDDGMACCPVHGTDCVTGPGDIDIRGNRVPVMDGIVRGLDEGEQNRIDYVWRQHYANGTPISLACFVGAGSRLAAPATWDKRVMAY